MYNKNLGVSGGATLPFQMKKETLEPGLDILERQQYASTPYTTSNIYTGYWMLYIYDKDVSETLMCRQGNDTWTPVGGGGQRVGLYVPPYQLVEWRVEAGWNKWTSYYCDLPKPEGFSDTPAIISIPDGDLPESYSALIDMIRMAKDPRLVSAAINAGLHPTLRKLMTSIHDSFKDSISVRDLMKDLSIPTSTSDYLFQKYMNLTPIQYRNKLRIFESLRLIGNGMMSITESCYASGFNDYSRFYTHFTNELKISPRDFTRLAHTRRTVLSEEKRKYA